MKKLTIILTILLLLAMTLPVMAASADIQIKVVDSFTDLKVKVVKFFTDNLPDIKIKCVDSFLGVE